MVLIRKDCLVLIRQYGWNLITSSNIPCLEESYMVQLNGHTVVIVKTLAVGAERKTVADKSTWL